MDIIWAIITLCYSHPEMTMDFVKFAIAACLVYRLFSRHFKKVTEAIALVTDGLAKLTKTVSDLATAMNTLESNHSARIKSVEDSQKEIRDNQKSLEVKVTQLTISQGGT